MQAESGKRGKREGKSESVVGGQVNVRVGTLERSGDQVQQESCGSLVLVLVVFPLPVPDQHNSAGHVQEQASAVACMSSISQDKLAVAPPLPPITTTCRHKQHDGQPLSGATVNLPASKLPQANSAAPFAKRPPDMHLGCTVMALGKVRSTTHVSTEPRYVCSGHVENLRTYLVFSTVPTPHNSQQS